MKTNNSFFRLCLVLSAWILSLQMQAETQEVRISLTPQTIHVGDESIRFYDDGGPSGKTSAVFQDGKEGRVTFVPTTSGKKVMIDFKKVDIFEGTLHSQYIKVYNGSEVTGAQLLTTVRKGTTPIIRSSAQDGALTVVFGSTTSFTSEGFEAVVTQFVPQPMSVSSIDVKQLTAGTVAAGNRDEPILSVNIKTLNTEPALVAQKFVFQTNGTHRQISSATLYRSDAANKFSTTGKVAEAMVTADEFEMIPTSPVVLKEGDNHFWLAYTLADEAENGQTIDASLMRVTLSGNAYSSTNGNPEGHRKVENTIVALEGTQLRKVNEQLIFRSETSKYGSKYEGGNTDRIVTFVPLHAGRVVQIDFSKFDLYYSANNGYGVRAKFVVYEGQGTTGKKLWELTSTADKAKGPGKRLRSASPDGAITVVFNPKDSHYTAEGFIATVSEYLPQAMMLTSVSTLQASTETLVSGATAQSLLDVDIETNGNLSPLALKGLSIDLKNAVSHLSSVSIYALKEAGEVLGKTAIPLVNISKTNLTNKLNMVLPVAFELAEGHNWLRICVDVDDEAQAGNIIDAALTAVNINETTHAVTNGDPAGEREVQNVRNLAKGENGTIFIGKNTRLMLYDDGGKDGKESKSFDGTITFAPKETGYSIKLRTVEWGLTAADKLSLYHGGNKKAVADAVFDRKDKLDRLISKAEDGRITLNYTTGKYAVSNGFALEVTAVQPQPLSVASVKAVSVVPEKVLKGQTDVPMLRVEVEVAGEKGSLSISQLRFHQTTNGIVTASKVYATDTISSFSTAHLFDENTTTASPFTGHYTVTGEGTYYFWLSYDLSSTATPSQSVEASLTSVVAEATSHTPASTVTALATVKAGMSGTLDVGASAQYHTIQSAVDALKEGIDGPTTIRIAKGEYNERVLVPQIPGMSKINTLTITSSSGNYKDVKIYHDQYVKPGYSSDQMAKEIGVFTFDGADYTTLKGVEVTTQNLAYPSVVHLRNMSRNVTIDGCYIHCSQTNNFQTKINLINMYAPNTAYHNNDNFLLRGSLLEGGYIGVRLGGTGFVALPKQQGGKLEQNVFREQGTKAIYVARERDVQLLGNRIENTTTTRNDFNAIDIDAEGAVKVERNTIRLATKNYSSAIYVRNINGEKDSQATLVNNVVSVDETTTDGTSLLLFKEGSRLLVAHNTLCLTGKPGNSVLSVIGKMGQDVVFANNLLQNEGGGVVYRFNKSDYMSTFKSSQNNVFTTGTTLSEANVAYKNLTDWMRASGERYSRNTRIVFADDALLQPKEEGVLRNGQPLADVTTDVTGAARNITRPMIGAYEQAAHPSATAIGASAVREGGFKVDVEGKNLVITSEEADARVQIYTPAGMLVETGRIENGASRWVVPELPNGVYVVKLSSVAGTKTLTICL